MLLLRIDFCGPLLTCLRYSLLSVPQKRLRSSQLKMIGPISYLGTSASMKRG